MSDSPQQPWSNNPNSPNIPRSQYVAEKYAFIGGLAGSIFYGFVIILFFRCMGTLLNPVNRASGRIRWLLVAHTATMFSFVTVNTAMSLYLQGLSYVDKRNYPGYEGLPPGPFGYILIIYSEPISVIPTLMFYLNNWLADGLLLYRCHVVFSMNYWVIAFPTLMYIASIAMGIMLVYQSLQPESILRDPVAIKDFGDASFSISVSLNVLLTLMIVVRLIIHSRRTRKAIGALGMTSALYNAIVTMFIESSALYAVSFLLFIGPWASNNPSANLFSPILTETQVIAQFLIILRVANRTALTGDNISLKNVSTIHFGPTDVSETTSGRIPVSMGAHGETPGESDVEIEEITNEVPS